MATALAFPVTSDASQTTTPIGFNDDPIGLRWTGDPYHILGYAAEWKGRLATTSPPTSVSIDDADYWVFNHALVFANGPVSAPTLRLAFTPAGIGVNTDDPKADLHVNGSFRAKDATARTLAATHMTGVSEIGGNLAWVVVNRATGQLHYFENDTLVGFKTESGIQSSGLREQAGIQASGGIGSIGGIKLEETELKIGEGTSNPALRVADGAEPADAPPGTILDASGEPFDPSRLEEDEGGR